MKQANPINITHIDHVVIRVNDLESMIAFYQDVLGCKLERGPGEGGLAQLRAGLSLIDLVIDPKRRKLHKPEPSFFRVA